LLLAACPYINFFIQEANQKAIRHAMEERLEKGMLHTVQVKQAEISWAEKGKEAWINGRLFDIKSLRVSGEHIILTGLYDEEETMIVRNMLLDQQKQNASGNRVIAGFFQLFGFADPGQAEQVFPNGFAEISFANIEMNIFSPALPVLTPPPRFV